MTTAKAPTVAERIRQVLIQMLYVSPLDITPTARIANDLGADSLDLVEVWMAIEEEFDIEVPDEDAEKLQTVQAVVAYVEKAVAR